MPDSRISDHLHNYDPPPTAAAACDLQRHPGRGVPGPAGGRLLLPRLRAARGRRPRPPPLLLHPLRAPLRLQGALALVLLGAAAGSWYLHQAGRAAVWQRRCARALGGRTCDSPACQQTGGGAEIGGQGQTRQPLRRAPAAPPLLPQAKKWRLSIRIDPGAVKEAPIGARSWGGCAAVGGGQLPPAAQPCGAASWHASCRACGPPLPPRPQPPSAPLRQCAQTSRRWRWASGWTARGWSAGRRAAA